MSTGPTQAESPGGFAVDLCSGKSDNERSRVVRSPIPKKSIEAREGTAEQEQFIQADNRIVCEKRDFRSLFHWGEVAKQGERNSIFE